jgi:hypothetical protein
VPLWILVLCDGGWRSVSEIAHHSVLSKARARWGREVFEQLFVGVVRQCVRAKLVEGSKIHLDASLVAANVSRESVVRESLRQVYEEAEKKLTRIEVNPKRKWVSRTDPEAVVVKKGKGDRPRARYKSHRAVDDRQGVITAVKTTLADGSEPHEVEGLIDGHERSTGKLVETVVGDHQYGRNENYLRCVKRGIRCHLGDVKSSVGVQKAELFSREDFDYEAGSDRYRCPAGHDLKRYRTRQLEAEGFADDRMKGKVCQQCALKPQCTSSKHGRRLKVPLQLEWVELGRAQSLSPPAYQDRRRRKYLMEGSFGDATNCHHFKRARWRGLQKQSIQDLLIAVCQNVRILCRHSFLPLAHSSVLSRLCRRDDVFRLFSSGFGAYLGSVGLAKTGSSVK